MLNKKGITLTSLVITMIILIILAGVGIGTLRPGGLVDKAEEAKKQAQIEDEKEIVGTSVVQTAYANRYGNIERDELAVYVEKNAGDRDVEVIEDGNKIYVNFKDTERYYEVGDDGEVSNPIIKEEIEYAGDITKGGTCDGSEEKPYEINCIEDLVAFSIMSNGGSTELGLSSSNFSNKYIILKRTLDFNSMFSYNNSEETKYGDLNTDGIVESIRTELTKTAEGCIGFKTIGDFRGIFDGQENEIKNIYMNNSDNVGVALFKYVINEVKNLSLSGTIINNSWSAAGIAIDFYSSNGKIVNCKNYANITGYNMVGGIMAGTNGGSHISNCENYGNIKITGQSYQYGGAGGILGYGKNLTIDGCINNGSAPNGIVGVSGNGEEEFYIKNCINNANVSSSGILGWMRNGTTNIINCYNTGEATSGIVGLFGGANWDNIVELNIKNCYNIGDASESGIVRMVGNWEAQATLNMENCYNSGNVAKAIIGGKVDSSRILTNITNTYYDTSKSTSAGATTTGITGLEIKDNAEFVETLNSNIGTKTEWKRWKMGKDGYPCFE